MARHRIKKYSRRRSSSPYKRRGVPIVMSVIAFILLSFLISVFVGIMLGRRAEKIAPEQPFELHRTDYESNGKIVSAVEAYYFPLGVSPYDYVRQDINDLSVCVSHKYGELDYYFEIAESFNSENNGSASFETLCADAKDAGARVCAYIHVRWMECEDKYEREILKAYEIALINEMARLGADDILLLGISVSEENISEVEEFVSEAAGAAESTPLGVAVSLEIVELAKAENYLAARVRSMCDYLALDLTHLVVADGESGGKLEEIITEYKYYIKSYPMRILFSREESKLYIPALELGIEDLQIVTD